MSKKINFLFKVVLLFLLVIIIAVLYYQNKSFFTFNQTRHSVLQETRQQSSASLKTTLLFNDYENAINEYVKQPNQANLNKMLDASTQLNAVLNHDNDLFGLNVKRWVGLFQAWQYYAEQKLQHTPDKAKQPLWYDTLLSQLSNYQLAIAQQISVSQQDYNNASRDLLLYGDTGVLKADDETQAQIDTLYEQQAKLLVPQAIQNMQNQKGTVQGCMNTFTDLKDPKNMAAMVAYVQYQSRYCSYLVKSKTQTYCDEIRALPPIESKKQTLNDAVAVCQIAEKRLYVEEQAAEEKYGNLSYTDYFAKYVAPLAPKYVKLLEIKGKENRVMACDPKFLPIVNFRDPEIDAETAAYVIVSPEMCRSYFSNS